MSMKVQQLISGISNDLQRLLKHFSGTAVFTPFFLPPFERVPRRFDLYLKDDELTTLRSESSPLLSLGYSSLLVPINYKMCQNNCHYTQSNCALAS